MQNDDPKEPKEEKKDSVQKKISERFENLRKHEKIEELYHYAKTNTRDSAVYALLVAALILMLFVPFWGGLVIGAIGGIYFSEELLDWARNVNHIIESEGVNRSVVAGAVLVAFFIASPALFLGAAASVAVKKLVIPA